MIDFRSEKNMRTTPQNNQITLHNLKINRLLLNRKKEANVNRSKVYISNILNCFSFEFTKYKLVKLNKLGKILLDLFVWIFFLKI